LDIFALFIVFAHSNFTIKQEITKQAQRRFLYLIRELIYIILVITIIAFLLEKKDNSTISLFFAPLNIPHEKKELALKDLLFSVVITDLILKLLTVAIKILFTMLPRRAVEFKNRVSLNLETQNKSINFLTLSLNLYKLRVVFIC
jgi:heme/copper-type cytochrome/quinol oxidase subunit 1